MTSSTRGSVPSSPGDSKGADAELLAALITAIGVKLGTRAITAADRDKLGAYVELMAAPLFAGEAT